jgi:hypothetical protein
MLGIIVTGDCASKSPGSPTASKTTPNKEEEIFLREIFRRNPFSKAKNPQQAPTSHK